MDSKLNYIELEDVLQSGQEYVKDIAFKLGLEIRAVTHDIVTDTCFEKAELLGWSAERVVKAILLSKEGDNFFYGFVFPELGTLENPKYLIKKETLPRLLSVTKSEAKKFRNYYPPGEIEFGTSTPFLSENFFGANNSTRSKIIKKLFVQDVPKLNKHVVDISIGGFGEEAHKVSLHLNYGSLYEILSYKFGEKIQKLDLFF